MSDGLDVGELNFVTAVRYPPSETEKHNARVVYFGKPSPPGTAYPSTPPSRIINNTRATNANGYRPRYRRLRFPLAVTKYGKYPAWYIYCRFAFSNRRQIVSNDRSSEFIVFGRDFFEHNAIYIHVVAWLTCGYSHIRLYYIRRTEKDSRSCDRRTDSYYLLYTIYGTRELNTARDDDRLALGKGDRVSR